MSEAAENRAAPTKFVPRGIRFGEGQKGNPGGRPKAVVEVVRLAQQYTPQAIHGLAAIAMRDKGRNREPAVARVMAWKELLDRGWGKPIQPTLHAFDPRSVAAPVDVEALTYEQRDVLEEILLLTGVVAEPVVEIEGEAEEGGE